MKSNNRITLYMAVLVVSVMVLLPCASAQMPGPGGQRGGGGERGGMGDRGGRRGDMEMGPSSPYERGGDRGRGGPGSWMDREELTDFQISLILKAYDTRNPVESKKLQDERKDMSRDTFIQTLINPRHALPEYLKIMSDERYYTELLNWYEKHVTDEATGIREIKEENYDLYKKRLDSLDNKYRSIRLRTTNTNTPEELIPVLVKDLQLNTKQNELVFQIRITDDQAKKDSLTDSLEAVVAELYDLNIKQRMIQLKQIQSQIERLQQNLQFEMNQIETLKDPNVAEAAIKDRVDHLKNPTGFGGGFPRGGRPGGGRGNRPPQFTPSDINDQNRNPAP